MFFIITFWKSGDSFLDLRRKSEQISLYFLAKVNVESLVQLHHMHCGTANFLLYLYLFIYIYMFNLKGFCRTTKCKCIGRKGCPSCRCLRPEASAPGLYRFPLSTSIYSILLSPLLQYPICSYNVLHCSIMYYSNTSILLYNVLRASPQCASTVC